MTVQKPSWQATQSQKQPTNTKLNKECRQSLAAEHRIFEQQVNLARTSYRPQRLRHLSRVVAARTPMKTRGMAWEKSFDANGDVPDERLPLGPAAVCYTILPNFSGY